MNTNHCAPLLLLLSACSTASGADFFGQGGGGGGGDIAAAWTTVLDIDFIAEPNGALSAASNNILADGSTNLYGCDVNGTTEFNDNGLRFSHIGYSRVCLWLSSVAGLSAYDMDDDYARPPLRIRYAIDLANSFGTPSTGDGAALIWATDGTALTQGTGRETLQSYVLYDGATWDLDAYAHDGIGSSVIGQAGNLTTHPEYVISYLDKTDSMTLWGDAASFPADPSDFSTLRGTTYAGANRVHVRTGSDLTFGSASYEETFVFGADGDMTVSRLVVDVYK